jgi:RNA polymerase sigma-70 factor (ECF subfamily)
MSEEILTQAFTRLRKRFLQQALRMLPSLEDAEDALQDVFVRLWPRADTMDTSSDVEALTTVALRRRAIDLNRRRNVVPIEEPALVEQGSDGRDALQEAEWLMEQLLTPLQRDIIRLKEFEDRPYSEVAAMLGMQEAAVRMQLSRARKKLSLEWKKRKN